MLIRHLIVPLAATVLTLSVGQAVAQGAFPAPLPGQVQANDPAFPPVNGAPAASVGAPPVSPFPSAGAPAFGGGGVAIFIFFLSSFSFVLIDPCG